MGLGALEKNKTIDTGIRVLELESEALRLLSEKKNIKDSRIRLDQLESITSNSDFWSNLNNAKIVMKERQSIEEFITNYESIEKKLFENIDLYKFANMVLPFVLSSFLIDKPL